MKNIAALSVLLGLLAGVTVYADDVSAANGPARFTLNIEPQPVRAALKELSDQAGVQVLIRVDNISVDSVMTPKVTGNLTVQEAVKRLLANSDLKYEFVNETTVRIVGPPVATSGVQEYVPLKLAQAMGEDSSRTESSSSRPAETQDASSKVSEVIVTGTRFGNRTALSSPVPIDIVLSGDLRAAGRTDFAESLAATVPAFTFSPMVVAGPASATRPFRYRGLPPNEVLVLVNGKRWHPSGMQGAMTFDFNAVPGTAVHSVEVLRDGASAQYGSDAVAGVINVRLRRDTDTELVATTSQYFAGDGLTTEAGFDSGLSIGDGGFIHGTAYYKKSDGTNRQGLDTRQQYFALNASNVPVSTEVANVFTDSLPAGLHFDPREFTGIDRTNNFVVGNADRREAGVSFNAELPLSGSMSAYSFGGYMDRSVQTGFVWRRPLQVQTVRAIYPNGYAPLYDAQISDVQAVAGLKGVVGAWDWDVSQGWGFNDLSSRADTVNVSLGANSPTRFYIGAQRVGQATTNADIRRALDIGLSSPLNIAFGSEFRAERIRIKAGEPASYIYGGVPILDGPAAGTTAAIGSQGIGGYTPADAVSESRDSIAAYVDMENQLTDKLLVTLAGRYENYSDFGSTVNGKFSFLQQFNPVFALRGSVSTGFRAPSLLESFFSSTDSSVIGGQFFINRNFPVADPVAQALGAQALEPEESNNYSFGATFTLGDSLNFTADVYRVDVSNVIIQSSLFNDAGTRAFLTSRGFTGITSAQFFTNGIDKRVDGLDVTGNYTLRFDGGTQLTFSAGANFNDPQVTAVDPTPPQLAAVSTIALFSPSRIVDVQQGVPRTRINLSGTYAYRNLQVLLRGTRYGSTRDFGATPATDQPYEAKWITDLDITYDFNETVQLAVGAQNLFDVYPTERKPINQLGGALIYSSSIAPFGLSGGQYYARALFRF